MKHLGSTSGFRFSFGFFFLLLLSFLLFLLIFLLILTLQILDLLFCLRNWLEETLQPRLLTTFQILL